MATRFPEESFAALDVAGMNYGESRCALDQAFFPDRWAYEIVVPVVAGAVALGVLFGVG